MKYAYLKHTHTELMPSLSYNILIGMSFVLTRATFNCHKWKWLLVSSRWWLEMLLNTCDAQHGSIESCVQIEKPDYSN